VPGNERGRKIGNPFVRKRYVAKLGEKRTSFKTESDLGTSNGESLLCAKPVCALESHLVPTQGISKQVGLRAHEQAISVNKTDSQQVKEAALI